MSILLISLGRAIAVSSGRDGNVKISPMGFTKIDVAEAHICTAVRLFFDDAHPIPIHTLACSAREILTTLGDKLGIDTMLQEVARIQDTTIDKVIKKAHGFAGFMKHADRDADAVLEAFSDADNDYVLWFACHDFGRITGGMPIEAQVFEAWWFATTVKKVSAGGLKRQRMVKTCIRAFPGIRTALRADQKKLGRDVLLRSSQDPTLKMQFRRVVELPNSAPNSAPRSRG